MLSVLVWLMCSFVVVVVMICNASRGVGDRNSGDGYSSV